MAGHEWEDWFEREEFIGQISDIRVQNLQVERELVQKRTFTRWINLHLEKCDPPIEVHDLFQEIRDGRILMALLEELSGCKLLHGFRKSSHRIFRLNNIAKVLSFLEERNVKLVSIDAADVADGNSSIILGLIWNIILFFQIKELTGNIRSQFPSTSSLSSIPTSSDSDTSHSSTPSDERQSASTAMREHSKAIKKLLQWVQKRTRKYGVTVQDFSKSWTSGLAFLAVIKSTDSSLVDMRKALLRSSRENLEDAFRIAHYSLGIPRLLEPEDVSINAPDESIITYVSQFLEHFPGIEEPEEPCQLIERSVSMGWLNFRDSDSDHMSKSAHRSRVRERSYMFQKDTAQPPPKILISSVSEDRSVMSPSFKITATRSWSSDDILTDSPHTEDPKKPVKEVLKNNNAPQLSYTHSSTCSTVPESVNTESVMGDSAISSPDSWVESEFGVTAEKDSENQNYLCDSGTAWHVYHATPVEVTAVDEGFIPSIEERAPDEQQMTECCIDEGIYTLSSPESIQERLQGYAEQRQVQVVKVKEANLEKNNQDLEIEQEPQHSNTEVIIKLKSEQPLNDREQESSVELRDAEIWANSSAENFLETNVLSSKIEQPSSDHSEEYVRENILEEDTHRGVEWGKKAVDAQNHEGETSSQTESLQDTTISEEIEVDTVKNEREDTRNEPEILKERREVVVETQNEASEGLLKDFIDTQDRNSSEICKALENTCSTNIEELLITSLDTNIGMNIPLISIVNVPEEQDDDRTCNPEGQDIVGDNVDQPMVTISNISVNSPQNPGEKNSTSSKDDITVESPSENVKPTSSGELRDIENQHLNYINERNVSSNADTQDNFKRSKIKCESPHDDSQGETDFSIMAETQLVDSEHSLNSTDQPDGQKNELAVTFSSSDTATQLSTLESFDTKPNGKIGILCYEPTSLSRTMEVFYTDFDRGSPTEDLVGDPIEPMDLFYPDKEELIFTEPPDTESQNWPSVLSVSALQPAPASDTLSDDQEFRIEVDLIQEQDKVITNTTQETNNVFGSQQHCLLPGVKLYEPLGGDVLAGRNDSSEAEQQKPISARENTVPVRCDTSFSRQDENHIPPVLRHRKGAHFPESVDNQRAVTTKADNDDTDFRWSDNWELHVLLLLWLLLYCFWVLPQVDLKTLPDMLLNR